MSEKDLNGVNFYPIEAVDGGDIICKETSSEDNKLSKKAGRRGKRENSPSKIVAIKVDPLFNETASETNILFKEAACEVTSKEGVSGAKFMSIGAAIIFCKENSHSGYY